MSTRKNGANAALQNSAVALCANILLVVGGFLLQKVMAEALGQANLGLGSVFSNVISILSLAEMGVSTAIVYHLYAPLNADDRAGVAALMRLYARCYRVIALVVAAGGLLVLPFVHLFLRGNTFPLSYVRGIFALYLGKTVLSYFFAYRRSLLIADQRAALVSVIELIAQVLSITVGIILLKTTGSFAWYLASSIAFTLLGNLSLLIAAKRLYPYVDAPAPALPKETRAKVFSSVRSVFILRLSGVILTSTDAMIISSFVGVLSAGVYDNYAKITAALNTLVAAVVAAVQPTLGRLFLTNEKPALRDTLSGYTFLFYLAASFAGVSLACLMTPFVTGIWLSPAYKLAYPVVAICSVNFFLTTLRCPLWSMMEVSGMFTRNRNASMAGAALNLVLSLALVMPLGMLGVFIGTFVSQLAQVILKTRALFRYSFALPARGFALEIAQYFAAFLTEAALALALCALMPSDGIGFLLKMALCVVLPNAINLALFGRTKRMRWVLGTLREARGGRVAA